MGKRKGRKSQSEFEEIETLKKEILRGRSKGQFKEVADLLNRLGTIYRELKQFDDALEQHDEEAEITRRYFPDDKIGLAIAMRAKAEVYIEMKEEEEALPLVREYLKISRNVGDLVEEQRAHVTLGRVYLNLAIKYAEDTENDSAQNSKTKALTKAEEEFQKARELANHKLMEDKKLGPGLMDMRCGVLLNIAIVFDMKGNVEGSKQYVLRAIEIAREHKFYEHLYRNNIYLCEIHSKLENFKDAKCAAEEAARAGKALDNFGMETDARVLEARMYFLLNEVESGVRVLKRLRKQILAKIKRGHGSEAIQGSLEDIEPLLKSGVRITRKEDSLHATATTNYRARQKLYEELGDSYVDIGNYAEALVHYRNSIDNAEKAKLPDKEMAKLYFSVAATYKDKGDDAIALQYYQKEIEFHATNPSEAFKTQTNITLALEKIPHVSQEEIIEAHEKAVELARACDCPKKQMAAMKNFAVYLKTIRRNVQASEMENKADEIKELYNLRDGSEEPDSQDGLLDENQGQDDEIDLDNLTTDDDSSEEDENELDKSKPTKRKKFRVNEKGETALHTAAIKGDLKMVRRLLRQGQNVNAKDTGGWTPLHEACNFGHLEIIEELLQNGAKVNEACGKVCGELTPLHDAANNGHSAVIHILLKFNANVLVRDSKGNYPLDLLIAWRERAKADGVVFSTEDLTTYRETRGILKDLMEKGGRIYEKSDELRARKFGKRDRALGEDKSPNFELMESRIRGRGAAPIPVRITVDNYDPDDADAAVDLYSTTIRGLRRTRRSRHADNSSGDESGGTEQAHTHAEEPEIDGLIPESQYVDDVQDWLVDGGDLHESKQKQNKRKRDPMDELRLLDSGRNIRRRRDKETAGARNDLARCDIGHGGQDPYEEENSEELLDLDVDPDPEPHPTVVTLDESSRSSTSTNFDCDSDGPESRRRKTFSQLLNEVEDEEEPPVQAKVKRKRSKINPIVLSSDDEEPDADSEEFGISDYHRLNHEDEAFALPPTGPKPKPLTTLTRNRNRPVQMRLPFKLVQNDTISNPGPSNNATRISPGCSKNQSISKTPSFCERERKAKSESILRLKIRVNEKVFMVPVLESHFNRTIEWLCEECSKRYFEIHGAKPILSLSTKDGAILSGNDIIRIVLCGNETELIATIQSFDLQRLPDRFKNAAAKIPNFEYEEEILQELEVCQSSNTLNLTNVNLRAKIAQTLFQALQHQSSLRELILPGCSLHDEGIQNLSTILPTLPNLITLDLSCNGISANGLHELSEGFKKLSETQAQNQRQGSILITLDLSFNALGNSAAVPLTNLLFQLTQLKNLLISNCDFSSDLFNESRLNNALSKLRLEEVDVSLNEWSKEGLDEFTKGLFLHVS